VSDAGAGKRTGSRRGPRRRSGFQPALLLLALGITACIVAWGYLVYAAIDFGSTARSGNPTAWWLLALASLGAVACLFIGLMLVARVLRRLGITGGPAVGPTGGEPRPVGGRRTTHRG
jgi:RsiW-degrading membrane proteinase PrsW (M82 family)